LTAKARAEGKIFLLCSIISILSLTLVSKCSPLYAINDWYDPNCFYTVGKGIVRGLVPYRDLAEQKGPLVYFLHALAFLIDGQSMLGVFLFEIISSTVTLYFIYKIARLYVSERQAMLLLPLWALCVYSSVSFFKGDSVEEFCLPILTVGLYHLLKYSAREMPARWVLLAGVMAGCVLWMKFTLLGFWLAWLILALWRPLRAGEVGRCFARLGWFLLGMLIATAPWLVYFGIHGAVGDWLHTYLWVNIFVYTDTGFLNIPVLNPILGTVMNAAINPIATVLTIMGIRFLLRWPRAEGRYDVIITLALLLLGMYIGGNRFPYYHLLTMPYVIFGLTALAAIGERHGLLKRVEDNARAFRRALATLIASAVLLTAGLSFNTTQMRFFIDEEQLPQRRFARIMNEMQSPTLLHYGTLDSGFYYAADILPVNRFFCALNMDYEHFPRMMDEQNEMVREGRVDFIVVELALGADPNALEIPHLHERYQLVDRAVLDKGMEGLKQFALFQRRSFDGVS